MKWEQERDLTIAKRLENGSIFQRSPAIDVSVFKREKKQARTDLQLELFNTVPDSYDFVEKLISKLPRQRQREYFRKVYLREYHSIKDDGSIAFASGNKQRLHANNQLREILGTRLKKVFKEYHCNVSWILSFDSDSTPKWVFEIDQEVEQAKKFITVPTRADLINFKNHDRNSLNAKNKFFKRREFQKSTLPFYLLTENKLKEIAYKLATSLSFQQREFIDPFINKNLSEKQIDNVLLDVYLKCGQACESIGFALPFYEIVKNKDKRKIKIKPQQVETALAKSVCEKYWFKTMRKLQKRMIEHIAIACGEVSKRVSNYISVNGFKEYNEQVKKNFDFLKEMILENVDDPKEQAELLDLYLRSSSNPAIRRQEMMTQLNGIEMWADEIQHTALFLTLTAPSSFHATHISGKDNKKWSGASPKQTHQYLNKVWSQFRALLAKRDIGFYGMRVAEPHQDGTPHWHLLCYVNQEDEAEFIRLFKEKALQLDGNEQGAKKHRCKVEKCDKKKGSATAYIAKYIAKNVDGYALKNEYSDEDPTLTLKDNAKRAKAWASLWGIRQFQFYGVASIGVWRELRRISSGQAIKPVQLDDERLEELRICADVGCFASYLKRQGGAMAKRTEQPARLHYEKSDKNRYGESFNKIDGIFNQFNKNNTDFIKTRLKKWIVKKRSSLTNIERSEINSEQRSPWTCVSNCNRTETDQMGNYDQFYDELINDYTEFYQQDRFRSLNFKNSDELDEWDFDVFH